jgi:histidinol-phosphate phosphatase family protein
MTSTSPASTAEAFAAPRQAVFLVGGLGTRLGALTQATPKPLLEVGGRPFLAWLLREVARHGFTEAVMLGGYRGEQLEAVLGDGSEFGLTLRHVIEPEPAGTAGALTYAADLLDETFLLLNGDSLLDINLLDLCLPLADGVAARAALRQVDDAGRYGRVSLDGDRVTGFSEKTNEATPGVINGGVYWMRRAVLDRIDRTPMSLEQDVFPGLVAQGALEGRVYERPFIDIGVPSAFSEAQSFVPSVARRGAVFFDRDGTLNVDVGYAHRPDQIEWMPGAVEAIKRVNDAGLLAFVVTNQAGVARGYYGAEEIAALHAWMQARFNAAGAHVDAWAYCPHHPDFTEGGCSHRKPAPGMIRDLIAAWDVDPAASLMIGDQPTDVQAAEAAGVRGLLYAGGDLDAVIAQALSELPPRQA